MIRYSHNIEFKKTTRNQSESGAVFGFGGREDYLSEEPQNTYLPEPGGKGQEEPKIPGFLEIVVIASELLTWTSCPECGKLGLGLRRIYPSTLRAIIPLVQPAILSWAVSFYISTPRALAYARRRSTTTAKEPTESLNLIVATMPQTRGQIDLSGIDDEMAAMEKIADSTFPVRPSEFLDPL